MSMKFFTNCNVVDVVNEKVFAGSVLVEDSVTDVEDEYECSVEGTTTWHTVRQEDLDADGIQRCGMFRAPGPEGLSVYLPVICRQADGTLQGMVYRVPRSSMTACWRVKRRLDPRVVTRS